MKKEFSRIKQKRKAYPSKRGKWPAIIFLIISLLLATWAIYHYKKPQVFSSKTMTRATSWFVEHRHHLQKKLLKVKKIMENEGEEKKEIHFEFYTALPNMQIKPQISLKNNQVVVTHKKIFDAEKIKNDLETKIQTH